MLHTINVLLYCLDSCEADFIQGLLKNNSVCNWKVKHYRLLKMFKICTGTPLGIVVGVYFKILHV